MPVKPARPVAERLESRSFRTPSGCIETTYATDRYGYPKVKVYGRGIVLAHRLAYEAHKGAIPAGAWVLHTCDNKGCINPEHLYLGSVLENNRDKFLRGVGCSPVTWDLVRRIREMRDAGLTQREIAEATGKSKSSVGAICANKAWHE